MIFIDATLSENLVSSFTLLSFFALKVFRILISSGVILASGSEFIILNASLFDVCIFRTFVPGIARHDSSFVFSCPTTATSAMSDVAYLAAQIRFSAASVEARSIDLWEYVIATGLFRFLRKNDKAADV